MPWPFFSAVFAGLLAVAVVVPLAPARAAHSQPPEREEQPTPDQVANVERLISVWSFVKYHHSDARAGKLAMDLEFFELYPAIRRAPTSAHADRALSDWLAQLGPGAPCDPCAQTPEPSAIALASPTPQWLASLPGPLAQPLTQIYNNRGAQEANFAVHSAGKTREAIFTNEADYSRVWREGDEALWALTLARSWAALHYWFPYRDIMDESPEALLPAAVSELLQAQSAKDYQNAISRFAAGADDSHVTISQFYGAFMRSDAQCTIPYSLRYIEGRLVVDGRQMEGKGALKAGDALVSIAGKSVEAIADRVRPFIAASNSDALGRNLAAEVRLGPCDTLDVEIERAGTLMTTAVKWDDWRAHKISSIAPHYHPGETIEALPGGFAYVRYQQLQEADLDRLHALANAGRGLVLDMRGYASANLIAQLGGMLVDEPVAYSRFSIPSPANPGEFLWREPSTLAPRADGKRITVPVVALIDHSAQSAPEYVAMALRGAGVPVIGSRSTGADGNVTSMPLPTGGEMRLTGLGVYYPDKSPTQRIGIVPDIEVRPTIAGVAAGRDEVLERALDYLLARAPS